MMITAAAPLDQLIGSIPDAQDVLRELRIDYANRGTLSLADACALAGADLETAMALLEAARIRDGRPIADWAGANLFELTRYIVERHHRYTREALVEIDRLLGDLIPLHRMHSHHVDRIQQSFRGFRDPMSRHMLEEEQLLFPYIERLEASAGSDAPIQPPFFETVRRPINKLVVQHGESLESLQEILRMRELNVLPRDCHDALVPFFERVAALEHDINEHMYLENTILLPRAVKLEADLEPRFSQLGELW